METYLRQLVSNQPADYLEIRLEEAESTLLQFRGPALDNLSESVSSGGYVRAMVNGGWGFVSFNRHERLEDRVAAAIRQARLVSSFQEATGLLAPAPVVNAKISAELHEDPRAVPLAAKKALLESYNRRLLEFGPPIASSRVAYFDRLTRFRLANSDGTYLEQEKMDLGGSLTAIARRDGDTQMFSAGFGSSNTFGAARGLEEAADDACRRAIALVDAPVVEAGEYPVVVDPILAGVFVHEAFGHLSEGDNVYENPRLREVMTLGRLFGRPHLNVFDAGNVTGVRGYLRYDDEGVAAGKTYLIREGKLVGRLHSRQTAGKMGEAVTGNARCIDYRFPPICRMRTTVIEAGEASFEDMIGDIKLGVYARASYGGQTAGEMFTFTAGDAVMIRDGRLAEVVRNVTLSGNVFETLKNIDLVGKDFAIRDSAGGCGKGRQAPLATSMGSPHIRIQKVVMGGRTR